MTNPPADGPAPPDPDLIDAADPAIEIIGALLAQIVGSLGPSPRTVAWTETAARLNRILNAHGYAVRPIEGWGRQ